MKCLEKPDSLFFSRKIMPSPFILVTFNFQTCLTIFLEINQNVCIFCGMMSSHITKLPSVHDKKVRLVQAADWAQRCQSPYHDHPQAVMHHQMKDLCFQI